MNIRFLKFLVFAILSAFYLLFPTQILASTNVGYTDITGYYPSANNGTSALCTLIEVPDSGTVTSVSTHIQNTQANLFKVAIYTDNGGQPGNLIENTVTQGVPVSNQVNSLTLTNPYHFLGNFWVCTAFNGNVYNYAYTDGSSAALDGFNFGTFPATFIPTWVSNEQNYAVFATVDYDSSVTPTPTSVPMEPFGEGTFTASNYSFDPITHVLSFNASNFNPPRTTGISDINDFAITMYNSAGQFVLDYYNYSVAPCNQGTIFNLTAIFNQEVCYNQYWHADLPTNDAIVYLRIAQGGSGNYHSQPIHADELFTSVPTPTGTPSTGGTFTASNYHFDPVTHVLSFTASNFNPPRSASTDIVNDFAIGLHNGGGTGQFVLDYFNYSIAPCNEGVLPNLTTVFNHEICYNQYWHADLPTDDTLVNIRVANGSSGTYRSQPIPVNQLVSLTPDFIVSNPSVDHTTGDFSFDYTGYTGGGIVAVSLRNDRPATVYNWPAGEIGYGPLSCTSSHCSGSPSHLTGTISCSDSLLFDIFDGTAEYFSNGYTVSDIDPSCSVTPTPTSTPTPSNQQPTVTWTTGTTTLDEGDTFTGTGSFTDLDSTSWEATVNYGDGTGVQSLTLNPDKTFSLSHVYEDNGVYTISVSVTDNQGATGTSTGIGGSVTVNNPAPVIDPIPAPPPTEQNTPTIIYVSYSDYGDQNHTATVNWGDGSTESTSVSGGEYSPTHNYENPGTYTVIITVTDVLGATTTQTLTITVLNVNPEVGTITVPSPVWVNESVPLSVSFTDQGVADTHTATIDWGDGQTTAGIVTESNGSGTVEGTHQYAAHGTYTITATVTDDDDGVGTATKQIVVNNRAPYVDPLSDAFINQGGTYSATGSFTDPDSASWTATVDYDEGAGLEALVLNPDKTFNLNHQYNTAGEYTVIVTVTDNQLGTGITMATITVNARPQIEGLSDAEINYQDDYTASGSVVDSDSTSWTGTVDYGDSSGVQNLTFNNHDFILNHTYFAVGEYTVTVTVTDNQGATYTQIITVKVNGPAHINQLLGATITEGATYIENGSFADSDSTSWTATVNYDEGAGVEPLSLSGTTFVLSNLYEQNGTYNVTVTITDNQGASGTETITVTVHNANPQVGAITASTNPIQVNTSTTATATFTDAGVLDTHTAVWDWGDGTTSTGTVIESNGSGSVSDSHTYTAAGVYEITLTVTDNNNTSDTEVFQYISVYSPTPQGLFNGVRKFNSPAGAYPANPSLTGQVMFGITAKYQGTTPIGDVSMDFNAANFEFEATGIATLVISNGNKATLSGTGTVNGNSGYTFLVTGFDGGSGGDDYIRFQIKDTSDTIVFDSQPGAGDTVDPTALITAGNVVIH